MIIVLAFLFPISLAFATRCKIWLGKDHLLCVDSSGYTETYKRFYFRDIQAITMQQTNRGRSLNIILGIISAFFLIATLLAIPDRVPASWSGGEQAKVIILGTATVIVISLLLINIFSGPTCKTQLRTAVQVENLPPLRRVRKTRKVLDQIRPLIVAAQGQLAAGEISARMQETISPAPSATVNAPPVIS